MCSRSGRRTFVLVGSQDREGRGGGEPNATLWVHASLPNKSVHNLPCPARFSMLFHEIRISYARAMSLISKLGGLVVVTFENEPSMFGLADPMWMWKRASIVPIMCVVFLSSLQPLFSFSFIEGFVCPIAMHGWRRA